MEIKCETSVFEKPTF